MSKKFGIGICLILVAVLGIALFVLQENNRNNTEVNDNGTMKESNSNENTNVNDTNINNDSNGGFDMKENDFISKINVNINGTDFTATLEDNETTRKFLQMLPLEINMSDLNSNEKYYYFNDSLPNNSSRVGRISNGDIMLYGSDCLVIFYESFNSGYSYTRIGKIDNPSSLKQVVGKGSIKISITK